MNKFLWWHVVSHRNLIKEIEPCKGYLDFKSQYESQKLSTFSPAHLFAIRARRKRLGFFISLGTTLTNHIIQIIPCKTAITCRSCSNYSVILHVYALALVTCTNINPNTAFRIHLIQSIIMISISNRSEISFSTLLYIQIRDIFFQALLEILNVNCWVLLRSWLYDKRLVKKNGTRTFVPSLHVNFSNWDGITRRDRMIASPYTR